MRVVLRSDVEKLGTAGEVRNVAAGFARNYLIPKGLAMEATPETIRWFERGREKRQRLRERTTQVSREVASKLAGVALSFTRAVGEQGKLFGSVGKSDIVGSLKASGFAVEKSAVVLDAAIKQVGDCEVEIRLHPEVSAKIKVSVLARS